MLLTFSQIYVSDLLFWLKLTMTERQLDATILVLGGLIVVLCLFIAFLCVVVMIF